MSLHTLSVPHCHEPHPGRVVHKLQHCALVATAVRVFPTSGVLLRMAPAREQQPFCAEHLHSQTPPLRLQVKLPPALKPARSRVCTARTPRCGPTVHPACAWWHTGSASQHAVGLHARLSARTGHAWPPGCWNESTLRLRHALPPPQLLVQMLHPPHCLTWQSPPQLLVGHVFVCTQVFDLGCHTVFCFHEVWSMPVELHALPPPHPSTSTARERVTTPGAQLGLHVLLHALHAPHVPGTQSTGLGTHGLDQPASPWVHISRPMPALLHGRHWAEPACGDHVFLGHVTHFSTPSACWNLPLGQPMHEAAGFHAVPRRRTAGLIKHEEHSSCPWSLANFPDGQSSQPSRSLVVRRSGTASAQRPLIYMCRSYTRGAYDTLYTEVAVHVHP